MVVMSAFWFFIFIVLWSEANSNKYWIF